jgi:tRNA uridine 5-carboxymethylaminomethyl modification enzyme
MFTSRVEYRLLLREDNADLRLTPIGFETGLIDKGRHESVLRKREAIEREITRLKEARLEKRLRRPGTSYGDIAEAGRTGALSPEEIKEVEIDIKYGGFIERQLADIERFKKIERIRIPEGLDFKAIHGLSSEVREKLSAAGPANLGQASRISGVTPAAISILMVHLEKLRRRP